MVVERVPFVGFTLIIHSTPESDKIVETVTTTTHHVLCTLVCLFVFVLICVFVVLSEQSTSTTTTTVSRSDGACLELH